MQADKWYKKALKYFIVVLIVVLFSPLILIGLIIFGIITLFQAPTLKKEYKKSRYYSDIKRKFNLFITSSPEYRFYNSAVKRDLPIEYRKQKSNGLEFFIYDGTLFLFPDFLELHYDEEKSAWTVGWYSVDTVSFSDYFKTLTDKIDSETGYPVRLLCERKLIDAADLKKVRLPEEIYLTSRYELAFDRDDSPLDFMIPQTTQDLYNMMIQRTDLCGSYELKAGEKGYDSIYWTLGDAVFELCVGHGDGYIAVSVFDKQGKPKKEIANWSPEPDEMIDEVISIGKRGNVTVLYSFMGARAHLYSGVKQACPYLPPKKHLFQKYYYIEVE